MAVPSIMGIKIKYNSGFHGRILRMLNDIVMPFYTGDSCLVLGPSEGGEIEANLPIRFDRITFVDKDKRILEKLKGKFTGSVASCDFINTNFEDLKFDKKFDTVIMFHVLEHIEDPIELLKKVKTWINGHLLIIVPNADSIHRLLGVKMKLIKNNDTLDILDRTVGHKRVYDLPLLRNHLRLAGFFVYHRGGIMLKPFHNTLMNTLSNKQIKGLMKVGHDFIDNCADIFVVAR
jgi:2-polyprenyl-3-methyl-5-hydroxy-6-metoxy-1,4-benzoquinol methylase